MKIEQFVTIKDLIIKMGPVIPLQKHEIYRILAGKTEPTLAQMARIELLTGIKPADIVAIKAYRISNPKMPHDNRGRPRKHPIKVKPATQDSSE